MILTREQLELMIAQAKRDAPNETWGMIGGKNDRAQKVFEMKNVAPTPVAGTGEVDTFTINHQPWVKDLEVPYVIARVRLEYWISFWRTATSARLRGGAHKGSSLACVGSMNQPPRMPGRNRIM